VSAGLQSLSAQAVDDGLLDLIYSQLHDYGAGLSIGCLGALAEFHEREAQYRRSAQTLTVVGEHGALAVQLADDTQACAYEAPSTHGEAWQVGITLLAPGRRGATRSTLTELGADHDALAEHGRNLPLFDLGLAMPNVDYCVRSSDAQVIAALRAHCGETVVTPGHPLLALLIEASPTRVVISPLARIEVYQSIARERTPQGSHTHLLPDLLTRRRTHAANLPLPSGALPLLTIHPENPVFDNEGRRRQFNSAAYMRFQALLERYGVPEYVLAKSHCLANLTSGQASAARGELRTRIGRTALRIAQRQAPYLCRRSKDVAGD
jgi:hypothetical protein